MTHRHVNWLLEDDMKCKENITIIWTLRGIINSPSGDIDDLICNETKDAVWHEEGKDFLQYIHIP